MVGVLFAACLTNRAGFGSLVLGIAYARPLAVSKRMASVLIVAGGTGRAAFRATMLRIAVIAPTAILEAVVGIGVARVAAKTA